MTNRFFVDTSFLYALVNRRDQYHARAIRARDMLAASDELFVTDLILYEVGNNMSLSDKRRAALRLIEQLVELDQCTLIFTDELIYEKAFSLFKKHIDKPWGLVDCASFVVMKELSVQYALTADKHFEQAGFIAVLNAL
jgi:predicted nucleic acid-binding protein